MKYNKIILIISTVAVLVFSVFNLIQGYNLIGKTFAGFGVGASLIFSPVSDKTWSGYNSKMENYDLITVVDGVKVSNASDFESIIQAKKPNTPVSYAFKRGDLVGTTTIKTMIFSFEMFSKTFLLAFIVSLFYLLIAIFVIFNYKEKDEKIQSLLFFALMFSLSSGNFHDQEFNHKFVALAYLVQVFTISAIVQLGLSINRNSLKKLTFNIASYSNIMLSSLLAFSLLIFISITQNDIYQYEKIFNIYLTTFNLFVKFIAIGFLSFMILIAYNYKTSKKHSIEKVQNRIIFTGSILSFAPYFIFWFIPTIFGYKTSLQNILPCFIALPIFITYSIIRYKAFDIEVYIRKGLIYLALSSILVFGYFSVSTFTFIMLEHILSLNQETYIAISAILATIMTGKLNEPIQRSIDKAFYRDKLDLTFLMESFMNEVVEVFDKKELLNTSISYLEKTINPLFVGLYLSDGQKMELSLLGSNNSNLPKTLKVNDALFKVYAEKKSYASINNFFTEDIVSANSTLLLPLQIQKDTQTLGVLVLGQKKSELDYMFEEKNFLKNFVASLSMALNNLMLKEETVSLTGKNIELENKALFLKQITANLSHDLKFPLNSAYSVITNLKYSLNSKNKAVTKESFEKGMGDLSKSLRKIGEYIDICLDKELIALGKLVLKNEEVNVKQVCEDAVFLHSEHFEKKEKTITCSLPKEEVFIMGDSTRLESVISNLISNATKYGGKHIDINLQVDENNLLLEVFDNGKGIEESLKDRVFECYVKGSQVSTSGKERSTGLGLFIAKNYIERMNGSITFESDPNKGTKFSIKLPLINKDDEIDYYELFLKENAII